MKSKTLVAICILINTTLTAQTKTDLTRKGAVFGFSSGIAHSILKYPSTTKRDANLALNWKIGYMLHPKLALLVVGSVSVYEYDLSDRKRLRDLGGVFASAQYFISDKFWVLGGLGIGTDAPVFYDLIPDNERETDYYSGLGVISSLGFEIYRKKSFAIDLQTRVNYSSMDLPLGKTSGFAAALLVGINFY